jgi:hypothetical protein
MSEKRRIKERERESMGVVLTPEHRQQHSTNIRERESRRRKRERDSTKSGTQKMTLNKHQRRECS